LESLEVQQELLFQLLHFGGSLKYQFAAASSRG
jgi:hypothetical protein